MDPVPLFTALLWSLQALTAAVLLTDAYFKMRATRDEFLQHKRERHVQQEPFSSRTSDETKNASSSGEHQAPEHPEDTIS